jgi:hypothetical protein
VIARAAMLGAVALLAANAADAADYFVQGAPARACPRVDELMLGAKDCVALPVNARVAWNGHRIDGFRPRYLGGDAAHIISNGRALFVYANMLRELPWRDPLKTEFVLARDAVACPDQGRMGDALHAVSIGDRAWLAQTGCMMVPAGTAASRLSPELAGRESLWHLRLRFSQGSPRELWMNASDFP